MEQINQVAGFKKLIAVCGPGQTATPALERLAFEVGREIALAGYGVVCGGRGGVMAAACAGARQQGGLTVGILPGYDPTEANAWVEVVICTGLGEARNTLVAATGLALIAVGGEWGTLSEMALALKLGRPVVSLGGYGWQIGRASSGDPVPGAVLAAPDPPQAVVTALMALKQGA